MKRAIITGSTGLVGIALAKLLCSKGIQVLCLGRKERQKEEIYRLFNTDVLYLEMNMSQIKSLPDKAKKIGWDISTEAVFYNFAWSGTTKLTDGTYRTQLNNATYGAEAVKVAKRMNCSKFINCGSMEETYIEDYLKNKQGAYHSSQTYYGLAKLASKNICTLISYLDKIDYIHTRLSVPLASDLSVGGYVSSTLMKIFKGEEYEKPSSDTLFDIILINEVVRAFYLIGLSGKNKANYYIGTGNPKCLHDIFDEFNQLCKGIQEVKTRKKEKYKKHLFNIQTLKQDVGFFSNSGLTEIHSALGKL